MKRIYATAILTLLLIAIGWYAALATTQSEQNVLGAMINDLTGIPSDWSGSAADACINTTVHWSGLACDINNRITGIQLPGQGVVGNIPLSFTSANLANVTTLDLSNNGLYTSDSTVDSFISGLQSNWKDTQVVPPIAVNATALSDDTVLVLWTPNPDYGSSLSSKGYNVYMTQTPGSGYTLKGSVTDYTGLAVSGLYAESTYYFIVNETSSTAESDPSTEVSAVTKAVSGTSSGSSNGGTTTDNEACYIATAAYGSYLDPHVQALRDFRDHVLEETALGRALVGLYYRTSPPMAEFISKHETARTLSRIALTPLVYGVAYPGLGFAMIFGSGALGALWWRRRKFRPAKEPEEASEE